MKKLIILAIVSLFTLTGCDNDLLKPGPTRDEYMVATFPGAKIYRCTSNNMSYLVEQNGAITEFYVLGTADVRHVFVPIK